MKPSARAQKLLVELLVFHFGGDRKLAHKLFGDPARQHNIRNWRQRGCVPLKSIIQVADVLKVSPCALNYKDAPALYSGPLPEWDEVIEETPLSPADKQHILELM
jgi:hypothetical protein